MLPLMLPYVNIDFLIFTNHSSSQDGTSWGHGRFWQGFCEFHQGCGSAQSVGSGSSGYCQPPGHGLEEHWHHQHGTCGRDQVPSPVAARWSQGRIPHQVHLVLQVVLEVQEDPLKQMGRKRRREKLIRDLVVFTRRQKDMNGWIVRLTAGPISPERPRGPGGPVGPGRPVIPSLPAAPALPAGPCEKLAII